MQLQPKPRSGLAPHLPAAHDLAISDPVMGVHYRQVVVAGAAIYDVFSAAAGVDDVAVDAADQPVGCPVRP